MVDIMIVVLSKKDDTVRRASIQRQLDEYNINFVFFDAITPADKQITHKVKSSNLTSGELCCAEGHLEIIKLFLASQDSILIVMEDDVVFLSNPKSDFYTCQSMFHVCDVLIMGYVKITKDLVRAIQFFRPLRKSHSYIHVPGVEYCYPYKQWKCGALCYAVSRAGAQKMLEFSQKHTHAADDWPAWENCGLRIMHRRPLLAIEDYLRLPSNLESDRKTMRSRPLFLRYLAGVFRYIYMFTSFFIKK